MLSGELNLSETELRRKRVGKVDETSMGLNRTYAVVDRTGEQKRWMS